MVKNRDYLTNTRDDKKPILSLTTNEYQIIFVDTPGMGKNYNLLSKKLTEVSKASLDDNDLIYFVVDRKYHESQKELIDYFKKNKLKVFLVINKTDLMKNKEIDEIIISFMNL